MGDQQPWEMPAGLAQRHAQARALLQSTHMHIGRADGPQALSCLLRAAHILGGTQGQQETAAQFRADFMTQVTAGTREDLARAALLADQLSSMSLAADAQHQPAQAHSGSTIPAGHEAANDAACAMQAAPALAGDLGSQCNVKDSDMADVSGAEAAARQHALQESLQCPKCGGLVARARWQQHVSHWCPAQASQPGD